MSHKFESGFFVGEPAWHRLGTVLPEGTNLSVAEALQLAGLDWQVVKKPVLRGSKVEAWVLSNQLKTSLVAARDGRQSLDEAIQFAEKLQSAIKEIDIVEGYKATVRESDNSVLGMVSDRYIPLQNREAFSWFDFLIHEGDAVLESAGSLKNGRRVWVMAKIQSDPIEVQPGDKIEPYLILHNSHDGTGAVWAQFTPIRVVCWNTLMAVANTRCIDETEGRAFRVCHTGSVSEKLNRVHQILDLSRRRFQTLGESFKTMATTKLHPEMFEVYLEKVLEHKDKEKSVLERRTGAAIQDLFYSGIGNNGKTVWDAYNGVTEWLDRSRGRQPDTRLESSWFGNSAVLRQRAYNEAVALL